MSNYVLDLVENIYWSWRQAYWWVAHRCIPRYRYHMINTGLGYGYHDEGESLLYASMVLLCEYIKACGGVKDLAEFSEELRNLEKDEVSQCTLDQIRRQEEAIAIYNWWTEERPRDRKKQDELIDGLYGNRKFSFTGDSPLMKGFNEKEKMWAEELRRVEEKIDTDEQTMLHRLIDIRPGLWT